MVWGVLVGKMGWRGCCFVSGICQVVEELGEVEEGWVRVCGEGFPGLDAEVIIPKVYVVCPLGGWGGGYEGHWRLPLV